MYDAVAEKRIAGAALDVYAREPYEPIDPGRDLRKLSAVILLPHVGSNTADANRGMAERALANIRLAEAGDFAAMDLLNPEVLERRSRAVVAQGFGPATAREPILSCAWAGLLISCSTYGDWFQRCM